MLNVSVIHCEFWRCILDPGCLLTFFCLKNPLLQCGQMQIATTVLHLPVCKEVKCWCLKNEFGEELSQGEFTRMGEGQGAWLT